MNAVSKNRQVSAGMIIACGVWLVGLGLYFIVLRPPLLPEDPRFMGTTLAQIRTAVPGLESWLRKVFTVMGGFMASAGVLTVFVATAAMPARLKGTSFQVASISPCVNLASRSRLLYRGALGFTVAKYHRRSNATGRLPINLEPLFLRSTLVADFVLLAP